MVQASFQTEVNAMEIQTDPEPESEKFDLEQVISLSIIIEKNIEKIEPVQPSIKKRASKVMMSKPKGLGL